MEGVIRVLRGNAAEPPANYGVLSGADYTLGSFATLNERLFANPAPAVTPGEISNPDPYAHWFGHGSPLVGSRSALFKLRSTLPWGSAIRLTDPVSDGAGTYQQDIAPVWSPRGDEILFTRRRPVRDEANPAGYRLMTIPSGGGEGSAVGTGPGNAWLGVWDPSGSALAWTSDADSAGAFAPPVTVAVRTPEGAVRTLTSVASDAIAGSATWSGSGRRLAYVRTMLGADSVWVVPASGGRPELVADDATQPSWQPGR
jgi:Tol biopolymer transport system component